MMMNLFCKNVLVASLYFNENNFFKALSLQTSKMIISKIMKFANKKSIVLHEALW